MQLIFPKILKKGQNMKQELLKLKSVTKKIEKQKKLRNKKISLRKQGIFYLSYGMN